MPEEQRIGFLTTPYSGYHRSDSTEIEEADRRKLVDDARGLTEKIVRGRMHEETSGF